MPSVSGVIPHSQLFNRIVDPSNEFAGSFLAAVLLVSKTEQTIMTDIHKLFDWAEERFE
jgi:hypothetical protein